MNLKQTLSQLEYPGRGIIVGQLNEKTIFYLYFIMGRSENSQNRVFSQLDENTIQILPYDITKVSDPSLIIYHPVKRIQNQIIVTNGDQTDTIFDYLNNHHSFYDAIKSRTFEPDAPNFTPRISALIDLDHQEFNLAIIKSQFNLGKVKLSQFFNYPFNKNYAYYLHTYSANVSPLLSYVGEPKIIEVNEDLDLPTFASNAFSYLNEQYRISLVASYIDLETKKADTYIINKYGD